jgi:hypothetical protein
MNEGLELKVSNPDLGQYTDAQKDFYDNLIQESDALGMYVFQETNPPKVVTNLYHSFESVKRGDGGKGKYQRIIDELYDRGASLFESILDTYRQAIESGDDLAIDELDLNEAELELVKERA